MSDTIEALATALAAAQAEMKNAPLNKVNPHFKNKYADLAAIRDATLPALNKHGLSIWQGTEVSADGFFLITRLIHKSGQTLASTYPLPLDTGKPQIIGSALTYARRYAWAAACGITADDDDDAEGASKAKANGNGHSEKPGAVTDTLKASQVVTIRNAIAEAGADEANFLKWIGAPSIELIAGRDYQRAIAALNSKRAAHK